MEPIQISGGSEVHRTGAQMAINAQTSLSRRRGSRGRPETRTGEKALSCPPLAGNGFGTWSSRALMCGATRAGSVRRI
jgi:hypothetical protein